MSHVTCTNGVTSHTRRDMGHDSLGYMSCTLTRRHDSLCMCPDSICACDMTHSYGWLGEVGGWGRDSKKCTGRDWSMGSSTIQWNLRPVVKYHLRRGVGFVKFLENGTRPQAPTSRGSSHCDVTRPYMISHAWRVQYVTHRIYGHVTYATRHIHGHVTHVVMSQMWHASVRRDSPIRDVTYATSK